jgi:BolA protein
MVFGENDGFAYYRGASLGRPAKCCHVALAGTQGIHCMGMQEQIQLKLQAAFSPVLLEVENESHGHNVPRGSETHFRVVVVSAGFEGRRAVARHQQVYAVLAEELKSGVHALALHTWTPAEWHERGGESPESPPCMGGSRK